MAGEGLLLHYISHPRCNIIYLFSLYYGLLSGLGSLLRMFCFLCFTSAVSINLVYPTGDEPIIWITLSGV